jgi:hypothetical protein
MKKVLLIIDIIVATMMVICIIYNVFKGMANHDVYYLVLGLFDYIILFFGIKNIERDIKNVIDT